MRILVVAVLLASLGSPAHASKSIDVMGLWAMRPNGDRHKKLIVPSRPSMFVHFADHGPREMPSFFTAAGTPIRVTNVATIQERGWNVHRISLDINEGVIVVRFPGEPNPVATYTIDPTFVPKTRSVELRPTGITLWIDSDAVFYAVDGRVAPEQANDGRVHFDAGSRHRVVALYPNGTEEVIYDGVPIDRTESAAKPSPEAIERAEAAQHAEDRDRIQWIMLAAAVLFSLAACGRVVMRRAADSDGP